MFQGILLKGGSRFFSRKRGGVQTPQNIDMLISDSVTYFSHPCFFSPSEEERAACRIGCSVVCNIEIAQMGVIPSSGVQEKHLIYFNNSRR